MLPTAVEGQARRSCARDVPSSMQSSGGIGDTVCSTAACPCARWHRAGPLQASSWSLFLFKVGSELSLLRRSHHHPAVGDGCLLSTNASLYQVPRFRAHLITSYTFHYLTVGSSQGSTQRSCQSLCLTTLSTALGGVVGSTSGRRRFD